MSYPSKNHASVKWCNPISFPHPYAKIILFMISSKSHLYEPLACESPVCIDLEISPHNLDILTKFLLFDPCDLSAYGFDSPFLPKNRDKLDILPLYPEPFWL